MNDFLVTRLWLADVATMAQRAVLGTLAFQADASGSATLTRTGIAKSASLSQRSVAGHLDALAGAGWITITRARSIDGRYNAASTYQLTGAIDPKNGQVAILTASQLPPDKLVGRAKGLRFDPERVGPAWAWRAPAKTATERMFLASMALLSDARGVCLAPRATMADRSLMSRRSADRVLRELESRRLVGREPRRRGQRAAEARLAFTPKFLRLARPVSMATDEAIERPTKARSGREIVNDGDGLRRHLAAAIATNWSCEQANVVAELITDWAKNRTRMLVSRRAGMTRQEAISDITVCAWIAVQECAEDIVRARNPWGLLATIVARRVASQDETDRGVVDLGEAGKIQAFTTVDDDRRLEAHAPALDHQLRGTVLGMDDLADAPAMDMLVRHLASVGIDPGLAWPVLCRCVEISLSAQNSRRHTLARADFQLEALGLTPDQASAWMNLVTGTRRGGHESSALANIARLDEAIPASWLDTIMAA